VIFADSRNVENSVIEEVKKTPLFSAKEQYYIQNQPDFEIFRDEILKQLKSTVKAVLVIFCQDGIAFLK